MCNQKNLIYKRTVYELNVKVNKNNLTKNGYFDLEKIPDMRILDNGFLKVLRKRFHKTQKELSRLVLVPLRTWIGWESYNKSLPFGTLLLLSKKLKIDKEELYQLVRNTQFTYGKYHGKNRLNIPIKPKEFDLAKYLVPIEHNKVYLIKNAPSKIKKRILKCYSFDSTYFKKTKLITIYSYLLNRFLRTFYIYEKELLLKFPLSNEISNWTKLKVDLAKAIIIPLALSDGGEKTKNRLFFSGASKVIHDIWSDAWFYQYKSLPSSFLLPFKKIFVTTHYVAEQTLSELRQICPSFKTSPRNQTKEDYLDNPQPSINFLFDRPETEQQIAIRLWANTEGSIGIRLDKRGNLITPNLRIACAHPFLIKELQVLCKVNGINFSIVKEEKNWAGLEGLRSTSIKTAINFLKIGGFIRGTKIASQSKWFKNLDKQEVLLGILEFILRQRKDSLIRTGNKNKVYKEIKKIVINKEFKEEKFYLNKFKNFDNWTLRRSR